MQVGFRSTGQFDSDIYGASRYDGYVASIGTGEADEVGVALCT